MNLDEFVRRRNKVFEDLDEAAIRSLYRELGMALPADSEEFWAAIHKAISGCYDLSAATRQRSVEWLAKRGMSPLRVPGVTPPPPPPDDPPRKGKSTPSR